MAIQGLCSLLRSCGVSVRWDVNPAECFREGEVISVVQFLNTGRYSVNLRSDAAPVDTAGALELLWTALTMGLPRSFWVYTEVSSSPDARSSYGRGTRLPSPR